MDSERTYRLELERRTYGIGHVANGNTVHIPRMRPSIWRQCLNQFSLDFIAAVIALALCVVLWALTIAAVIR